MGQDGPVVLRGCLLVVFFCCAVESFGIHIRRCIVGSNMRRVAILFRNTNERDQKMRLFFFIFAAAAAATWLPACTRAYRASRPC